MSTNISKERRDELIRKIRDIKTYISSCAQDENTAQLLTYIGEIEKVIKGKKYGLVFEEHREGIDEILETHVPILTEEKDLLIDNGGQMNFLIEGDNLAALKLLEKTHKGKIDVIYIDPPYNTGKSDFMYDDNFVDANDTFRHSKWLSFMEKRLKIAKEVLSKKGIILISIDDNEYANLTTLCDSVFSEQNHLLTVIVNRTSEIATSYTIQKHEYILVYTKDLSAFASVDREPSRTVVSRGTVGNTNQTQPIITFPAGLKCYNIQDGVYHKTRKIDGSLENITNLDDIVVENGELKSPVRLQARWRSSNDMRNFFANQCRPTKAKISGIITQIYFDSDKFNPQIKKITSEKLSSIFLENKKGSIALSELGIKFPYPKSVELLLTMLRQVNASKKAQILDFFAGSGTTGHAVMKLNAEDGGNRQFILCTNNENNICREITYKRIKRVIEKENYAASLKYFKIDYLPISDKLYYEYADDLLKHIRELVELENGINFTGNAEIAIVLTEEELDRFTDALTENNTVKTIYLGHDVLPNEKQERLFKQYNISINIIPDYYYRDLEG